MDILEILTQRGFINQVTDTNALQQKFNNSKVVFYAGYDGTANSLHIGNLVTIMALRHLQKAGHKPIVLVGGGTTRIGDPSGKNKTRQVLSETEIDSNAVAIKNQLSKYLDFSEGNAILVNNADWLLNLNYISFLRDIGSHFSVNRMITSETYKARLDNEETLSFIEFNYQILQAYDFYILNEKYGCTLQVGGSDQWGNIVAGIDLTRRLNTKQTFGITFPLVTNADGSKMGKSVSGAIWLDGDKLSPYEFYQYWINIDDRDVKKFLCLFTELSMSEIETLSKLEGAEIRQAKKVLAYETTKITHGVANADLALKQSEVFVGSQENAPTLAIPDQMFSNGEVSLIEVLYFAGFHTSKAEARRLITQGGARAGGEKIQDVDFKIKKSDIESSSYLVQSGKKKIVKLTLVN
jgi:tyrosyl-tRNA synthetase